MPYLNPPVFSLFCVQVVYNFHSVYLLQEPLLIVGSFLAFFVLAMAYFRIELSLSDPKLDRRASAHARSIRGGPIGDVLNSQSHLTSHLSPSPFALFMHACICSALIDWLID